MQRRERLRVQREMQRTIQVEVEVKVKLKMERKKQLRTQAKMQLTIYVPELPRMLLCTLRMMPLSPGRKVRTRAVSFADSCRRDSRCFSASD